MYDARLRLNSHLATGFLKADLSNTESWCFESDRRPLEKVVGPRRMYARASQLGSCRVPIPCKMARTASSPGRVAVYASWCSCTVCTDTGTPCVCLLRVYIYATFCTIFICHRQSLFSSHSPVGMTWRVICFPPSGRHLQVGGVVRRQLESDLQLFVIHPPADSSPCIPPGM